MDNGHGDDFRSCCLSQPSKARDTRGRMRVNGQEFSCFFTGTGDDSAVWLGLPKVSFDYSVNGMDDLGIYAMPHWKLVHTFGPRQCVISSFELCKYLFRDMYT